jgi:hypothetical protein
MTIGGKTYEGAILLPPHRTTADRERAVEAIFAACRQKMQEMIELVNTRHRAAIEEGAGSQ